MSDAVSANEEIEWRKRSSSHWQIVLNRPSKYNALTVSMYQQIIEILGQAERDPNVVLLSIKGNGPFYSSGTDLTDPAKLLTTGDLEASLDRAETLLKSFVDHLATFPKILVALINGPAVGIAVSTLPLFDAVFASSRATFALPFIRTGQSAEGCSSWTYPQLMGSLRAKDLLLFDRKLNAEQAERRGLVTRVIDDERFDEETEKICQSIVSLPHRSLLVNKSLLGQWSKTRLQQVNHREVATLREQWLGEDFGQAIQQFLSRRTTSKL